MKKCPLCKQKEFTFIYDKKLPIFQNVVYNERKIAIKAKLERVRLSYCQKCGFIFNQHFDNNKVVYSDNYQNEQGVSAKFKEHLEEVYNHIAPCLHNKKVVEIGCGKGLFLEILQNKGVNIIGFDPAYEGSNKSIIKDLFSSKYNIDANFIILRHTLEHIQQPFDFLKQIAYMSEKSKIYIEVPTFDWICANNAIEDIFYEHCNYFTTSTLSSMFREFKSYKLFGGQYIGLIAELKHLKKELNQKEYPPIHKIKVNFEAEFQKYSKFSKLEKIAIWGAGAKGSTFLNLFDKDCSKISCVVDINPKKQNKYIGGTGHQIISPEELYNHDIKNVIVMNNIYINEIRKQINPSINLLTLDQINL